MCLCVCYMLLSLLAGCRQSQNTNASSHDSVSADASVSSEKIQTEQTEFYRIYNGDTSEDRWYYYYDLFDSNGNTVRHECTYMNEPRISHISDDVIKVSAQTGTGRSTQWTYFYNSSDHLFSPTFQYVLDESSDLVAFFDGKKIIVRDIFDDHKFYRELELREQLADTTDPIVNAVFSEDNTCLTVTYQTNSEKIQMTTTFLLR